MTPLFRASGVLVFFGLAGCAPSTQVDGDGTGMDNGDFLAATEDSCGAATRQNLVGRDASVLNVAVLPDRMRVVYPDVDDQSRYEVDRLTVRVDGSGVISRVECG